MLYPLKFIPIYKDVIWGGRNLEQKYGRKLPSDMKIGEVWGITNRQEGVSIVSNGFLKNKTMQDIINEYPTEVLGQTYVNDGKFPLLIKIIDANDSLSIQVHPDGVEGKTEAWYIIDAKERAKIVYGLNSDVNKENFIQAIKDNKLRNVIKEVEVKAGDIFFIPAGKIHALGEGIIVAEIQQNSNTTYRVYDWDRVGLDGQPRQLHIEQALEVINFNAENEILSKHSRIDNENYVIQTLVECDYFKIEEINIHSKYCSSTDFNNPEIIINIENELKLTYESGEEKIDIIESVLLPASLGAYSINGKGKILRVLYNSF